MNYHIPVLFNECIKGLDLNSSGIYVDGTFGGGGHTFAMAKTGATIYAIDQDTTAIERGNSIIQADGYKNVTLVHSNFSNISAILHNAGIGQIDGVLLDLGVSSHQIDTPERGFSYIHDGLLDMRMDKRNQVSAHTVINTYPWQELARIFKQYGEEPFAKPIAKEIERRRAIKEITTTAELKSIIDEKTPKKFGLAPIKRVFQAIRIEVNNELGILNETVTNAIQALKLGGRLCIITFHSLEDRIIKQAYAELANPCKCPRDFPHCVCGKEPQIKIITRKPILPTEQEMEQNPRSKSAKLRIAEKI